MRSAVWRAAGLFVAACLLAGSAADARADSPRSEPPTPPQPGDEPCPINAALVVAGPTLAYLACELGTRVFAGTAHVWNLTAQGDNPTEPAKDEGAATLSILTTHGGLKYISIAFSRPLEGDGTYVLAIGTVTAAQTFNTVTRIWSPLAPSPAWAIQYVRFSTKRSALLVPAADAGNKSFVLVSANGLRQCRVTGAPDPAPTLAEQVGQQTVAKHAAVMRRQSRLSAAEHDTATPNCELPLIDPDDQTPQFNPARVGIANIWLQRGAFEQASVNLNIEDVVDSFGQKLSVPPAKRKLTIRGVPKAKDDSTSTSRRRTKPPTAPRLPGHSTPSSRQSSADGYPRPFNPTVKLDADVGFGQLQGKETTKTTNTIKKIGAGLTGLFTTGHAALQAVRFTSLASFEGDRDFTQKKA